MSDASWKAHFKQIISGYDPVEAQGLSELGYALQHKQISEEEYLEWAREKFELPSIDMKFFQIAPASKEIFEKMKDAYLWGPECVPIAEWEEFVIVACLEKPQDFPMELKPLFVLAPVAGTLKFWKTLSVTEEISIDESSDEVSEIGGMPEGFEMAPDTGQNQNSSNPTPLTGLSFTGVTLGTATAISVAAQKKAPEEAVEKPKSIPNPIPTIPTLDILKSQAPQENTSLQIKIDTSASNQSAAATPPLKPKVQPPKGPDVSGTAVTIVLNETPSEADKNTEIKAIPQVMTPAAADTTISPVLIKEVFEQVKKHYTKQLFLEFNEATKTAIAKYWPDEFVATQTPSAHSYSEDSFLAVVAKTQKSYHGHIIKNTITEQFFKELNSGIMPENITLVPIVNNDFVVGAMLGWGEKSTYNMTVLRDMETAVAKLVAKFGWNTAEAA
jgi:hypothetical protein